ncbi:hypothetical protein SLS53_000419 [Cytospora paraplurivora]|uniref:Cytochrome P450 n=1 Tax=Cytospora paraplurivora TaxID=2898453 RepID=A0AAN9YLP1_9PEZI
MVRSELRARSTKDGRRPPDIPYWFPLLGHIIPLAQDPAGFLARVADRYGAGIPVRIKVGPRSFYILSSPTAFMTLTKASEHLTPKPSIAIFMENMFGTRKRAGKIYRADDSGINPKPLPGTSVAHKDRMWFHQNQAARKYLSGKSLHTIGKRFMAYLSRNIGNSDTIGKEWVELPDLYDFWKDQVFEAALTALFGPHLLRLNPSFTKDFWDYNAAIPMLLMGFPRWITPWSYAARDRVLEGIKKWHQYALAHADVTQAGASDPEWEENWGSVYLKVRYNFRSAMEAMDADAHASDDLALMVAANANAMMSASWFLIETLRDRALVPRLLAELDNAREPTAEPGQVRFDIDRLCSQPLLSSIYTETLRLRIGLMINRTSQHKEVRLGPWRFPPNMPIGVSTVRTGSNPQLWNDRDGKKPLDKFWAERCIVYPDDPDSGPWSRERRAQLGEDLKVRAFDKPTFTMDGMSGGWIPYGAGEFMCPGRHLAKQEMIGSYAVFLASYDVELLVPDGWEPQPDTTYFGTGTMPPLGKIPCRIRKRAL